eukprot:1077509-Prorocentrum_minimum.AAC.5
MASSSDHPACFVHAFAVCSVRKHRGSNSVSTPTERPLSPAVALPAMTPGAAPAPLWPALTPNPKTSNHKNPKRVLRFSLNTKTGCLTQSLLSIGSSATSPHSPTANLDHSGVTVALEDTCTCLDCLEKKAFAEENDLVFVHNEQCVFCAETKRVFKEGTTDVDPLAWMLTVNISASEFPDYLSRTTVHGTDAAPLEDEIQKPFYVRATNQPNHSTLATPTSALRFVALRRCFRIIHVLTDTTLRAVSVTL